MSLIAEITACIAYTNCHRTSRQELLGNETYTVCRTHFLLILNKGMQIEPKLIEQENQKHYTPQYCKCISWMRQTSGGLTYSHRKLPCRLAGILIDKACLMFRLRCECFSVSNLGRIPPALHGSTLTTIFCPSHVPIACVMMST